MLGPVSRVNASGVGRWPAGTKRSKLRYGVASMRIGGGISAAELLEREGWSRAFVLRLGDSSSSLAILRSLRARISFGSMRVLGLLLLFTTACKSGPARGPDFDRLERDFHAVRDDLYQQLWGAPRRDADRVEDGRGFACVWDDLGRAGRDPVPDMECLIRRLRSGEHCFRDTPSGTAPNCAAAMEQACAVSSEFVEADRRCRPPDAGS
jgi:hypothetical protein